MKKGMSLLIMILMAQYDDQLFEDLGSYFNIALFVQSPALKLITYKKMIYKHAIKYTDVNNCSDY